MRTKREGKSLKKSLNQCDELEGIYANTFKVGYNAYEFVIDFGQYFDDKGNENFHTRIITNPKYVESFSEILRESIKKFKDSI